MKQIIGILLILGMLSCKEPKSRIESIDAENLSTIQIDSILEAFSFEYETPIIIDSADQVLFPISTSLLERRKTYSYDGYESNDFPRYWNVFFFNQKTKESRLLTEGKIRIDQIYAKNDERTIKNKFWNGKILYTINDEDYNEDGKLDAQDPKYLFCTEYNGTNLSRISPLHEDLQYFEVVPESSQILINTIRDSNRDSIFNKQDDLIWYAAELSNNTWILSEIIDSTRNKNIKNLYFEQWLKKK